jgi:hypothetical protein
MGRGKRYLPPALGGQHRTQSPKPHEDVQDALWYIFDPQHYNSLSSDSKTLLGNADDFSYTESFLDDGLAAWL